MAKSVTLSPDQDERFIIFPSARPGLEAVFARSGQVFDRHTHDAYALGYIRAGGQRWHSGRGRVDGHAGNLIMSNPGEVHDGSPLYGPQRTWCMIHLDPKLMHTLASQRGLAHPAHYEFANPVVDDPRLLRIVRRLFGALAADSSSPLLLDELQLSLFGKLGQLEPRRDIARYSPIDPARNRLDDDPASAHSLAELAGDCDLSPWQLLRSFTKYTGLTPHSYLVQRRIELARRLIADGAALADASVHSGFFDQSHMTRMFRRRYGYSPGAWAQSRTKPGEPGSPAIPS